MSKNKLIALIIGVVTLLGPFQLGYMNTDISNMPLKILMMLLTMAGAIAAVAIGSSKAGESAH